MDGREKLRALIAERRSDMAALSTLIGRNPTYISQFLLRGTPRQLAERDRKLLAEFFGVSEQELGAPPDPRAGWVLIPRLSVRAAAGGGAIGAGDVPIEHIPFDPKWLRGLGLRDLSMLSMIRVEGDSMAPTLGDGDDILVDRSPAGLGVRDGIFVLRLDGALMVKRLAVNPALRAVSIKSDNADYPDFADCPLSEVDIIGRVVWAARAVR